MIGRDAVLFVLQIMSFAVLLYPFLKTQMSRFSVAKVRRADVIAILALAVLIMGIYPLQNYKKNPVKSVIQIVIIAVCVLVVHGTYPVVYRLYLGPPEPVDQSPAPEHEDEFGIMKSLDDDSHNLSYEFVYEDENGDIEFASDSDESEDESDDESEEGEDEFTMYEQTDSKYEGMRRKNINITPPEYYYPSKRKFVPL